jgi:hypothetical protein
VDLQGGIKRGTGGENEKKIRKKKGENGEREKFTSNGIFRDINIYTWREGRIAYNGKKGI